ISKFGNDTYIFNLGDGNDTIIDNKGKDTIKFNGDIKNLNFTKIADDLVIKYSLKDSVTIKNHFKNRRNNISKIEFNNNSYIKDLHNITKALNQNNIVNNNNLDKNNLSNLNKNLTVNLDNNINSFISQNQINKIIQDLNSYGDDNAINLNFNSEFKNNDIMQVYNG
ncbi:calcium-binding protein, partial [Campylobacter hominis]